MNPHSCHVLRHLTDNPCSPSSPFYDLWPRSLEDLITRFLIVYAHMRDLGKVSSRCAVQSWGRLHARPRPPRLDTFKVKLTSFNFQPHSIFGKSSVSDNWRFFLILGGKTLVVSLRLFCLSKSSFGRYIAWEESSGKVAWVRLECEFFQRDSVWILVLIVNQRPIYHRSSQVFTTEALTDLSLRSKRTRNAASCWCRLVCHQRDAMWLERQQDRGRSCFSFFCSSLYYKYEICSLLITWHLIWCLVHLTARFSLVLGISISRCFWSLV